MVQLKHDLRDDMLTRAMIGHLARGIVVLLPPAIGYKLAPEHYELAVAAVSGAIGLVMSVLWGMIESRTLRDAPPRAEALVESQGAGAGAELAVSMTHDPHHDYLWTHYDDDLRRRPCERGKDYPDAVLVRLPMEDQDVPMTCARFRYREDALRWGAEHVDEPRVNDRGREPIWAPASDSTN